MSYSSTSRSNILRPFAADLWGYGVYILGCPVKALTLTGAKECVFLVAGTCGLNRCRASRRFWHRDFRDGMLPRSCTRQKHAFVFDCEKEKNCLKVSSARIEQTGDWLYKETVVVRQVPDAAVSWTACRSPAGQETLQHRTLRTAEGEVTENVCPSEKMLLQSSVGRTIFPGISHDNIPSSCEVLLRLGLKSRHCHIRSVEDIDSKGCLMLAEEVGTGETWSLLAPRTFFHL